MKLYELIKRIPYDQDEITIIFSNDNNVKSTYNRLTDIPITYADYNVMTVYGYDANGYDGIMISIVEE
jgi:hypothetical protein